MSAQPEPSNGEVSDLPSAHQRILEFERDWWKHAGAKEDAIRTEFSLTPARYYQLLNALIDTPAAVRHDPMLVRRLLRARDARTTARATRAFSISDHSGRSPHDEESND